VVITVEFEPPVSYFHTKFLNEQDQNLENMDESLQIQFSRQLYTNMRKRVKALDDTVYLEFLEAKG
ncbi:44099_t:CDS:2, partial [Gigaspora margarita]